MRTHKRFVQSRILHLKAFTLHGIHISHAIKSFLKQKKETYYYFVSIKTLENIETSLNEVGTSNFWISIISFFQKGHGLGYDVYAIEPCS